MTERRAALLTAAYYAMAFATLGAYLPYWPVWLENWGLDRAGIGFFLGMATLSRIAGSMILTGLADRYAIRRRIIAIASFATALALLTHLVISDSAVLLVATLVLAFVMAPQIPLGEALGLRASGRYGFGYAVVRAAGSVGFLAANIGVGWALDQAGAGLVPWICAIGFVAIGLIGIVHPGGGSQASDDRAGRGEWLSLLARSDFRWFLAAAALCQASHVIFYVYATLAWRDQGLSGATIGWLWAFGVIAETFVMLGPGRRLIVILGPALAIAAGGGAGVMRWLAMSAEPSIGWLWGLQGLHALTFALAHLGAMAYIAASIPARLFGTAQGVLSATTAGLSSAIAAAAGATVIHWSGISAGFLVAAAVSAASVGAAFGLLAGMRVRA